MVHYGVSEYIRKYSLSLNLHLLWIMLCELKIKIWTLIFYLNSFYQMAYFRGVSKRCPSRVCHLSDVTLYSFAIIPKSNVSLSLVICIWPSIRQWFSLLFLIQHQDLECLSCFWYFIWEFYSFIATEIYFSED